MRCTLNSESPNWGQGFLSLPGAVLSPDDAQQIVEPERDLADSSSDNGPDHAVLFAPG